MTDGHDCEAAGCAGERLTDPTPAAVELWWWLATGWLQWLIRRLP